MSEPVIRVVGLGKTYPTAAGEFPALQGVNLSIGAGEYLAIDEMQFPGKNRLRIAELLRGKSFRPGERFS